MLATSFTGQNTITVTLEKPFLIGTVTLPILQPLLLINGGQVVYSNVVTVTDRIFVLTLSSAVTQDLYITYSKPVSNTVPQLRYYNGDPVITQRQTKVLLTSQDDGSFPSVDAISTAVNSFGTEPSVDDFILTYGERESVTLSNLGDANESTINYQRIKNAIEDALVWIDTMYLQSSPAAKVLIQSSRRRSSLIIARYYLDSCRRREDITKDYELVIKEWELDSRNLPTSNGSLPIYIGLSRTQSDYWSCNDCNQLYS
jgi:phage gp36-like protein